MKAGLSTSLVFHAVALGFGLFTLSSPRSLEAMDVESFPVDIVPMEDIAQSVLGEREAPAETPAPLPTTQPDTVEDARNVGDNTADLDTAPTPDPRPRPVETAAAPPAPEPEPAPEPVEQPEPEPQAAPEPAPAPATEVAPEPQQQQEVAPDPVPETAVAEIAEAESIDLPANAPAPEARPQPPQAQTARTPERKEVEQPPAESEEIAQSQSQESEFDVDQIAALLNRQQPSGGGAERSTEQAALGGLETTGAELSQSEINALRGQIQRCWNVPVGVSDADDLQVSIRMRLSPTGEIEGAPEIVAGGGGSGVEQIAAEAARRAVLRCQPYNLPAEKYDAWDDVLVNFDPSDMF